MRFAIKGHYDPQETYVYYDAVFHNDAFWVCINVTEEGTTGSTPVSGSSDWFDYIHSVPGDRGDTGPSIYDIAVEGGFVGTVQEFLLSLKGDPGDVGERGEIGPRGVAGVSPEIRVFSTNQDAEEYASLNPNAIVYSTQGLIYDGGAS